jgi:hypothetical protein
MTLPKVLNLFSDKNDHAGFMLIAQNGVEMNGECVFMLTHVSVAGINSKFGIVISELKELGEHKFEILQIDDNKMNIKVSVKSRPSIDMEIDNKYNGVVYTMFDDIRTRLGSVVPLQQ